MAEEFKIIENQEQLDAVIKERLARLSKQHAQEKGDMQKKIDELARLNSDLTNAAEADKKKYSGFDDEVKSYKDKIAELEASSLKRRIAYESGIPLELAGRLTGSTEEEIKADAQIIAKYARTGVYPSAQSEPKLDNNNEKAVKKALLSKMANDLTGGSE